VEELALGLQADPLEASAGRHPRGARAGGGARPGARGARAGHTPRIEKGRELMTIGFLFWLLMVLWFVLGLYSHWPAPQAAGQPATVPYGAIGGNLLLFVLLFLLGWKAFGFVIQG
jgi:hypothetical protein